MTLKEKIENATDEELLEIVAVIDEYTEEAQAIINAEAARRDLSGVKKVDKVEIECDNSDGVKIDDDVKIRAHFNPIGGRYHDRVYNEREEIYEVARVLMRDDFVPLMHPFSKLDTVIANTILQDSKLPYQLYKCENETELNKAFANATEAQANLQNVEYPLFVFCPYKNVMAQVRELIEEHFEVGDNGCYRPRKSDVVSRLKAFTFNDIYFPDHTATEILDVDFTYQEKINIKKFAKLLLDETDMIEEERGQIVFFYDSLEPLIEKLDGAGGITRVDFLAIIEVCKLYCEDPRYDGSLNAIAESILDFFLS